MTRKKTDGPDRRRGPRTWKRSDSDRRAQEVLELHEMGYTAKGIAKKLKTCHQQVNIVLDRLSKTAVQRERDKQPRNQERKRPCLKCRQAFKSSWCGERICPSCRPTFERRVAAGPFVQNMGTG